MQEVILNPKQNIFSKYYNIITKYYNMQFNENAIQIF